MEFLVLVSCMLAVASAWNCPQLPVVDTLNVTGLLGPWFEQKVAGAAATATVGASCAQVNYTLDPTGRNLLNMVNTEKILLKKVEVDGWLNWENDDVHNGKLLATIHTALIDSSIELRVLDTDYENFLILFSCRKVFGFPVQSAWILSRIQNPEGDDKIRLDELVEQAFVSITKSGGPDLRDFISVKQNDCD